MRTCVIKYKLIILLIIRFHISLCYVYKLMNRSKKEYFDHIDYIWINTSSEYTTNHDFYKNCKSFFAKYVINVSLLQLQLYGTIEFPQKQHRIPLLAITHLKLVRQVKKLRFCFDKNSPRQANFSHS